MDLNKLKYEPGLHRVDAIYSATPAGEAPNPLVAALPDPWTNEQVARLITWWPAVPPDVGQLSTEIREGLVMDMADGFEAMPQHIALLQHFIRMIRLSYRGRARFVHGYTDQIIAQSNAASCSAGVRILTTTNCLLLHGLPGTGKTSLAFRLRALEPEAIDHVEFEGRPFPCRQVTHLYVPVQAGWTEKALSLEILKKFDSVAGSNYADRAAKAGASGAGFQSLFGLAAANHALGALILDEVQLLKNNKDLLNFALNFTTNNKIPLILVGTPESLELMSKDSRFSRRADAAFDTELKRYSFPEMDAGTYNGFLQDGDAMDDLWTWFIRGFWDRQFTATSVPLSYELSKELHWLSAGLPSYAVTIFRAAQLMRIGTDADYLDVAALREGYSVCTRSSNRYLTFLRKGNLAELKANYPDFSSIDLHEVVSVKADKIRAEAAAKQKNAAPESSKKTGPKNKKALSPVPVSVGDLPRAGKGDYQP